MKNCLKVILAGSIVVSMIVSPQFCPSVQAESAASAASTGVGLVGPIRGRILDIQGTVEVKIPGDSDWRKPKPGVWIEKGTEIKTGPGSACSVGLGEKQTSVIKMTENSKTTIGVLDAQSIRIQLEEGRVFAMVRDLRKDSTFQVASPTAVATARGTGWEQSAEEINVFESSVEVAGASGEMMVVEEGFGVDVNEVGDMKEPEALPEEAKSEWNQVEQEAEQQVEDAAKLPQDPGFEEPPATDAAKSDPPPTGGDDSAAGINPPNDPNMTDPGAGPDKPSDGSDPGGDLMDGDGSVKDGLDADGSPADSMMDPNADGGFDAFNEGFDGGFGGNEEFVEPGSGPEEAFDDAKDEKKENEPPPIFDPDKDGSSTGTGNTCYNGQGQFYPC